MFETVCTIQVLEVPSTQRVSQSDTRKVSKGQFFALASWQTEGKLARMEANVFVSHNTELEVAT